MKQAIKWCSGYTHRFREALAAMTPAIELLNHLGHPYDLRTFDHPANAKNYAQAAATALNIPADQIFKTLLWRLNTGAQIVAIAAASEVINPKALAKLAGAKKAELLGEKKAESTTGYLIGGISPLAQKQRLSTFVSETACRHSMVYVSAGRRGIEIGLEPTLLIELTEATLGAFTNPA